MAGRKTEKARLPPPPEDRFLPVREQCSCPFSGIRDYKRWFLFVVLQTFIILRSESLQLQMHSDFKACKKALNINSGSKWVCEIIPKVNSRSLYVLQILVHMVFQILIMFVDCVGNFRNKELDRSVRKESLEICFFLWMVEKHKYWVLWTNWKKEGILCLVYGWRTYLWGKN